MKKIFTLLVLSSTLCLCSCDNMKPSYYYGTEETAEKIANFVSSNMKDANNMSDEEMEDVIKELYRTAVKTFCTHKREDERLPNERFFTIY